MDHEVRDDAVEDDAVVQGFVRLLPGTGVRPRAFTGGQTNEVGHGLRCVVGVKLDDDVAGRGVQSCFHACDLVTPAPTGAPSIPSVEADAVAVLRSQTSGKVGSVTFPPLFFPLLTTRRGH